MKMNKEQKALAKKSILYTIGVIQGMHDIGYTKKKAVKLCKLILRDFKPQ